IVLIPDPASGPLASQCDVEGIEWHEIPVPRWFIYERTNTAPDYLRSVAQGASLYQEIILRANADVIVDNTLTTLEPTVAGCLLGLPRIAWVHGILDAGMLSTS